jgi:V8-like Glu-specific endopeptidase
MARKILQDGESDALDSVWSDEHDEASGGGIDGGEGAGADSATGASDLVGVESVPEYVALSSRATVESGGTTLFDEYEGEPVDADFADEPEFFSKIARALPRIIRTAKKLAGNPVIRSAVKGLLAAKGINLESVEGEEGDTDSDERLGSLLEVVIGADDRVRIDPATGTPWSGVCSLNILARNGQRFIGTGWMIAPRCVITAGHCVHIRTAGGFATHVDVMPGRSGASMPFGSVRGTRLAALGRWISHGDRNFDCGCIILPRVPRNAAGAAPFQFRYAAASEAVIRSRALNIAGYPGDLPRTPPPPRGSAMYFHARLAKAVSATAITYDIDTAGGQSGSPVWHLQNSVRTALGIHTNGSPLGNSATRITPAIKAQLDLWKAAGA